MAVINLRMSSVSLKVGAERPRAKDIFTVKISTFHHCCYFYFIGPRAYLALLLSLTFILNSFVRMLFAPLTFQYFAFTDPKLARALIISHSSTECPYDSECGSLTILMTYILLYDSLMLNSGCGRYSILSLLIAEYLLSTNFPTIATCRRVIACQ